jgi:hypothetical protein
MHYTCSDCRKSKKTFSLTAKPIDNTNFWKCTKIGETPEFGPPTPSRLIKLIGLDRDTFLKGRRCENQGLGIGAFSYYRRVVENQKNRIFDEIIRALKKLNADNNLINDIESAKNENQFSKAIESIKTAFPDSLKFEGHNPLALLHKALSEGLHGLSDDKCLDNAQSIRIILAWTSERLAEILREDAEFKKAVSRLLKK